MCWCRCWVTLDKHVHVVGHDFQSVNLSLYFLCSLVQQFSQSSLQDIYEDAFAKLRAPHKMILERKDRTSIESVPIISHVRIAPQCSISVKHPIQLFFTTESRPIPPPAKADGPLGLRTDGQSQIFHACLNGYSERRNCVWQ